MLKTVNIFPLAEQTRKFVRRRLSVRLKRFHVCSACACFNFKNYSKNKLKCKFWPKIIEFLKKTSRSPSYRTKVKILEKKFSDSSPKKFDSAYAQHRENVRKSKFWQKSKEKNQNFSDIDRGHIRFWFRSKKIQNYLMLVYL